MSIEQTLIERSGNQCEISGTCDNLVVYPLPPENDNHSDKAVLISQALLDQINSDSDLNANDWRCLNDTMWSQVPAVQVLVWRMLNRLVTQGETWAHDLLDMMYLDDDTKAWAAAALPANDEVIHIDSNGSRLVAGDNVVLIKDLDVKGTSFVAKRGTPVRGISVTDNPEHIEGRVNGTRIVILTKYVKKM